MQIDLEGEEKAYNILASLVTPRPIAWVTTLGEKGIVNVAPFSFFNVFGTKPPILIFTVGNKADGSPKDTARNILENEEFVVHMVSEELGQTMVNSSKPLEYGVSELEDTELNLVDSVHVRVPRVKEAPVALECTLREVIMVGDNRLIMGDIHSVYVDDDIIDPKTKHILPDSYYPIGRMASPSSYTLTREQFNMAVDARD